MASMTTGNLDKGQLSTWKVDELRKLAEDMGLDSTGKKAELIERICAEPIQVDVTLETAKEPEPEAAPKDDTKDLLEAMRLQNELLQKQLAEMQRQLENAQKPQVIQVAADTERVHFLWQAEVADYNLVTFGPGGMYGSITGKSGTFSVPKNELSRILDDKNRRYMAKRWLIVVDGLTDEERESLGVLYREGEVLDRKAFQKMVDIPTEEICDVYRKLCLPHKEMVGRRYYESWQARNPNVTREKVIALRNITRDMGLKIEAFQQILREMNASDEEE